MRRSAAPSICKREVLQNAHNLRAQSFLNIATKESSSPSVQKTDELAPRNTSEKRYEIVYAKRSTKKHKRWEDDGVLILSGLNVKICSTNGKALATSNLKTATLSNIELGMVLVVGAYECQLISELDENRELNDSEFHLNPKEPLVPARKPFEKSGSAIYARKFDERAFLLPRPPSFHIWKHNTEGLPITDVFVDGKLAVRLHPYQLEGIKFLYECVLGYRRLNATGAHSPEKSSECIYGGILADEMGLGKTVQVIGLLSVLLKQGPYGGKPVIRRCVIVTPGSLVMSWQREFSKWVGREHISTYCVNQDNPIDAYLSQMRPAPVFILSYEMLLQHADRVAKMSSVDLVVCDEGHRLKNLEIKTTTVLKRLPALRRIILTGTPIQNDLNEFWSLAEFVAPGCLASSREEYRTCFVNPLSRASLNLHRIFISTESPPSDALDNEPSVVLDAVQRLRSALKLFLLRRTSDMIARRLPDKVEQIVFCQASPLQRELAAELLKWVRNRLDLNDIVDGDVTRIIEEESIDSAPNFGNGADVLTCIMAFRKLYNHPSLVLEMLDQAVKRRHDLISSNKPLLPAALIDNLTAILQRVSTSERTGCSSKLCHTSGKLAVLQHLLSKISMLPSDPPDLGGCHRLVLVSNFTTTLDLLEPICRRITNAPCLRIDGKTPTKQRIGIVDRFNSPTCIEKVLLLSSKAGGIGLNLVGADFLVLFDIDWNPAIDAQALARIWREGQKRCVHLIRLIAADGLEERILQRQVAKSSLTTTAISSSSPTTTSVSLSLCELRELFQPPPTGTVCWTHDLLDCRCQSVGTGGNSETLPESDASLDEEEDEREFQLGRSEKRAKVDQEVSSSSAKGLEQIRNWSHFLTPEAISEAAPLLSPPTHLKAVFQHITSANS